jgi:hypothetical protein
MYSGLSGLNSPSSPNSSIMDQAEKTYQIRNQGQANSAPTDSGNWFSHLLPTLGSIAAPIIGGLLAPETGGLSLLAGAALSGAGSAAGKAGENLYENKNVLDGVAQSGGEGAAGGALGGIGGKLIGGILGKVGQHAATEAASQAAVDGFAPYADVTGKTLSKLNVADNIPMLQKLGINTADPEAVLNATGSVTGENGAINGIKNQIIQSAGHVSLDPDTLMTTARQAITANPQIGNAAKSTENYLHQLVQSLQPEGAIDMSHADPQSVMDAIKSIGTARSGLNLNGENGKSIANVYDSVNNQLQDALYKNAGADKLAAAYKVTPEDLASIHKLTGGNQALTDHIVNSIDNAQSIGDLRAAEAPFVQASQLAKAAQFEARGAIPTAEENPSNIGQHVGAIAQLAGGHPLAAAATAGGGALNLASKGAASFNALDPALKAAVMAGGTNAAIQPFTHAGDFTGSSISSPTTNNSQGGSTMNDQSNGAAPSGAGTGAIDPSMLTALVKADLSTTGGKNLGTLVPALQAAMFGGLGQLSPDQRNTVANSQTATQSLPGLQDAYNNAGGGHGVILGGLANLTAGLNPKLQAYNAEMQGAASKISAATGIPLHQAIQMLPQPTDTQEIAQQKMAAVQHLISTGASNATQSGFQTPGFGAGGTPIGGLSGLGSSAQVGSGLGAISR